MRTVHRQRGGSSLWCFVAQVEDTFDEFDSQPLVNFSVPEPTRVITVNITRNKTTPTFYVNGRTFTSPERPLVFGGAIPDSANVLCSYVGMLISFPFLPFSLLLSLAGCVRVTNAPNFW